MAGALLFHVFHRSRLTLRALFLHRRPLELLIEGTSDASAVAPELVTLGGVSREALHAALPSDLVFRTRMPRRAVLVVDCAVGGDPSATVRFSAAVAADGPTAQATARVETGPGRWQRLRLPVPAGPLAITLQARAVSGAPALNVWWGEPTLLWRKGPRELRRTVAFALRVYGVRGTLQRLRQHGAAAGPAAYARWFARSASGAAELVSLRAAGLAVRPRIALFLSDGPDEQLTRTAHSLLSQIYQDWEVWLSTAAWSALTEDVLPPRHRRRLSDAATPAAALNAALDSTAADFVATMAAGDVLAPQALHEIAARLNDEPDLDLLYSDEDEQTESGAHHSPHFKPGWSPEYLQSRMYFGRLTVVRRNVVRSTGGYREAFAGALDYDLALRVASRHRVGHVARVLYHRATGNEDLSASTHPDAARALADYWREQGADVEVSDGAVAGVRRTRHRILPGARITIVIPTDGRSAPGESEPLLARCLRGLLERTAYEDYEVLVADNGYLPEPARGLLDHLPHTRVSYSYQPPFNFSEKINFAVAMAASPYVLLLNDDVEPINRDWLSAMVEYAQLKQVGAVGAKLFYPDGRLQHAGVAIGVSGVAAHLLHQHPGGTRGCDGIAHAIRNCSAVTGACLLTRRAIYAEVGGFNSRLRVDFNDVDFCLRVRRAGYRIVFTPYARLYHHESASFGMRAQREGEIAAMRELWQGELDRDPYYNPNLSRDFADCRVADPGNDR